MALSDIDAFMAYYARSDLQTQQTSAKAPALNSSTSVPQRTSSASNAPSSSRQVRTQRHNQNVPAFSPPSSAEYSVSSDALLSPPRLAPTRSTTRWSTVAKDSTGGCDQFLRFHKEKPRAGKFYYPTVELETLKSQAHKQ